LDTRGHVILLFLICEVVIFNFVIVGFNSMSNLIVFHQSFLCMFVWVSVWNWWRNVKNRATHKWLASGATRERSHKEHMLEVEVFECDGISW